MLREQSTHNFVEGLAMIGFGCLLIDNADLARLVAEHLPKPLTNVLLQIHVLDID